MFFCFWEQKLFFKIQFPNTIFLKKTLKTVLKNCSQKLFSRTVFKNSNQTGPPSLFSTLSLIFLFFQLLPIFSLFLLSRKPPPTPCYRHGKSRLCHTSMQLYTWRNRPPTPGNEMLSWLQVWEKKNSGS